MTIFKAIANSGINTGQQDVPRSRKTHDIKGEISNIFRSQVSWLWWVLIFSITWTVVLA